MRVTAELGIIWGGRVIIDGVRRKVRRTGDGWYVVSHGSSGMHGRIRNRAAADIIEIRSPMGDLTIEFHMEGTAFKWNGRQYQVASMNSGDVFVTADAMPALRGTFTMSGVRLELLDSALMPIAAELAFGFALRRSYLGREWRREQRGQHAPSGPGFPP